MARHPLPPSLRFGSRMYDGPKTGLHHPVTLNCIAKKRGTAFFSVIKKSNHMIFNKVFDLKLYFHKTVVTSPPDQTPSGSLQAQHAHTVAAI